MADLGQKFVNAFEDVPVSLSGMDEAIISVRADRIEGVKDHRALG
jgi:hypothetical protein